MTEMKPYMTEKRHYERPRMRVVELRQRARLLQTSGRRSPYGDPSNWDWE